MKLRLLRRPRPVVDAPLYLLVVSEPDQLTTRQVAARMARPQPVHDRSLSQEPLVTVLRHQPSHVRPSQRWAELAAVMRQVAAEHPSCRVRAVLATEVRV